MRVQFISTPEALEAILPHWNALAGGVPFRSWQWLASWWRQYGRGHRLYVLAVRDDDSLRGIAPLYIERSAAGGRVLKLLGGGEVCSDYLGLLTAPADSRQAAVALAQWLLDANEGESENRWDVLELSGIAAADVTMAQFVGHLAENDAQVHRRPAMQCWRIELPATWDQYLAAMSNSHRKQIRRVLRRQLESGRAVLHTADADNKNSYEHAMQTLIDLHQRRRRALGEPGCFASARFEAFLREAAERLLAANQLELHWIELEGRPIAAEFHLVGDDIVYAYQAGVDPDALDEEPGRIINVATLKRAIERGRRAFDFLRGDEPYKAHWRAEPRPLSELRIAAPSTGARLRHGVWLAGDAMKHLIKTGLDLTGMR